MKIAGIILLLVLAAGGPAQQPNTPGRAHATWDTIDGPPWPIVVSAAPYFAPVYHLLSVDGGDDQGFLLAYAPAGTLGAGIPSPFGFVDLDPLAGLAFLVDGVFGTTSTGLEGAANTGPQGTVTWVIPFLNGGTSTLGGFQVLVGDPTSPAGATLTAATHLTVIGPSPAAIHVSASTGAPGNPGTASAPLDTITAGIVAALAAGFPAPPVRVALGTYAESPVFPMFLGVEGGFDPQTWALVPGQRSIVEVGATPARAIGVLAPTRISRLDFRAAAATAPGASSIAFVASDTNALLRFEDCRFEARDASAGSPGSSGPPGLSGSAGGAGIGGGSIFCPPPQPGGGGPGNFPGGDGGAPGQPGMPAPFGGGGGGPAGGCSSSGGVGGEGGTGGAGLPGASGSSGSWSSVGAILGGTWLSGTGQAGDPGTPGRGGGGGGGGGAVGINSQCVPIATGGTSGGGGAAGLGGLGGGGGGGGGISSALALDEASATFVGCRFVSGSGGDGGEGGDGGVGGTGGQGGSGSTPCPVFPSGMGGTGGSGGPGGDGGAGGGGAGGPGGPSFGIWRAGVSAAHLVNPLFTIGIGGAGGAGGAHGAPGLPPGADGPAGSAGPIGP